MLVNYAFPYNFVYSFALAAVSITISWASLALTREPVKQAPANAARSSGASWQKILVIVRGDHNFRQFSDHAFSDQRRPHGVGLSDGGGDLLLGRVGRRRRLVYGRPVPGADDRQPGGGRDCRPLWAQVDIGDRPV